MIIALLAVGLLKLPNPVIKVLKITLGYNDLVEWVTLANRV